MRLQARLVTNIRTTIFTSTSINGRFDELQLSTDLRLQTDLAIICDRSSYVLSSTSGGLGSINLLEFFNEIHEVGCKVNF